MKKVQLHQELKRNFVIERLQALGIQTSQQGTSIHELDYDDLKYELVLASFKEIDAETDSNRWF